MNSKIFSSYKNICAMRRTLQTVSEIRNLSVLCRNMKLRSDISPSLPSTKRSVLYGCQRCKSEGPLPKRGKKKEAKPMTMKHVIVALGIGGAVLGGMFYVKKEKEREIAKQRQMTIGKAKIGGQWELVDHTGKLRKSSEFNGKWMLLYFGFTHCPDICPDELEKMAEAVDILDKDPDTRGIVPIFITVDPERDTVEAVASYIAEFSPKFIGMTGSPEQIYEATRAYRVYYSPGPKDEDEDYIVDHTIIMYLINPDGDFTDYYGQNKKSEEVAAGISMHMMKWKLVNKK